MDAAGTLNTAPSVFSQYFVSSASYFLGIVGTGYPVESKQQPMQAFPLSRGPSYRHARACSFYVRAFPPAATLAPRSPVSRSADRILSAETRRRFRTSLSFDSVQMSHLVGSNCHG